MIDPGERWPPSLYLGVPGSGKTWKAWEDACAISAATGWPIGFLDFPGAGKKFITDAAATVKDFLTLLYGDTPTHARFIPGTDKDGETEKISAAIRACGGVVFLVDEISYVASSRSTPPNLESLLRCWRHAAVPILMTTQYPGDVSPVVRTCAGRVLLFRLDTSRALVVCSQEWPVDTEKVSRLEKRRFIEHVRW